MKKKENRILYTAIVNLNGLYHKTPIKCYYREEYEAYDGGMFMWWDKSGNTDSPGPGLHFPHKNLCYIVFSSFSEEEVKAWISGARAAFTCVKNCSYFGYTEKDIKNIKK